MPEKKAGITNNVVIDPATRGIYSFSISLYIIVCTILSVMLPKNDIIKKANNKYTNDEYNIIKGINNKTTLIDSPRRNKFLELPLTLPPKKDPVAPPPKSKTNSTVNSNADV